MDLKVKPETVDLYAIAVSTDEAFDEWMPNPKIAQALRKISKYCVGVIPEAEAQYLCFYTAADRNKALQVIRKAYPETMAAPLVQLVTVEKRFLK